MYIYIYTCADSTTTSAEEAEEATIQRQMRRVFYYQVLFKGKRHKAVYRLVTAPQGGTQKYTLTFAYDSPR